MLCDFETPLSMAAAGWCCPQTQTGIILDHVRIKALVEDATDDELTTVADSAEIAPEGDDAGEGVSEDEGGEAVEPFPPSMEPASG